MLHPEYTDPDVVSLAADNEVVGRAAIFFIFERFYFENMYDIFSPFKPVFCS